ncbi:MAG: hypothetical protein ACPG5B_15955 [Chitinophagales bacterium]
MKFLSQLFSIVLFLCCSFTTFAQTPYELIFELDQVFYHTTYNQLALPVSYNSPSGIQHIEMEFMFDDTKIHINDIVPSPQGSIDSFVVNFSLPTPNYFQGMAHTNNGSQTTQPVLYILFDQLTNEAINPNMLSNVVATIDQEPTNTRIIASDCVITNEFEANFDVHLIAMNCDNTENPVLAFEVIGDNPNMTYSMEVFSQNTTLGINVIPNMIMGNDTFQVTIDGTLSPSGDFFTFIIVNGNGKKVSIDKPIYACAAPDPCIASGGELTGEGKIIFIKGECPSFVSGAVQNESLANCGGVAQKLYLLLDSFNYIQAASTTVNFENICALKTEQYKAVHYIQCSANTPIQDIYDMYLHNPGNLSTINPYNLVGGCKALSTTVAHKIIRFAEQPPIFGNDGAIKCLDDSGNVSDGFFEGLNFAWSHAPNLNECEATNLGFGDYDLSISWSDAGLGQPLNRVAHFSLYPPVVFSAKAILSGAYDVAVGGMSNYYVENQLLPYEQPFAQAPWYYDGTETIVNPNNNIVDWVLLEVRDGADDFMVVEYQAALLLDDGTIVGASDFNTNLKFYDLLPDKAYHVSIKSRHHVAVMTEQSYTLGNSPLIDFRNANIVLDGTNQLKLLPNNLFGLLGGDFNADGVVTIADFNIYLKQAGDENVYAAADTNCDGAVTTADFDIYLSNVSHLGVMPIWY